MSEFTTSRSLILHSKPSLIVDLYQWISSTLKANNFSEDDVFAIHLALEEAFNNAVVHGNKGDTSKEIKIDCRIDSDKCEISLADQGQGFDADAIPDPRQGNNVYKPGGRGLFLMRCYMDLVEFNARGNCVRMVRYKAKPAQ